MATTTKPNARSAITRALALAAQTTGTADPTQAATPALAGTRMPTAQARAVIDLLVDAGSPEKLAEQDANFKVLLRGALDWDNPKFTRSTKSVARAVGQVAQGTGAQGSTYPQAVEVVGFLSMVAPLLEPDRLARIASHAAATPSAFGPPLYPLGPHGQLKLMLSRYKEPRREELLVSLWEQSHDGRWWDHTTGDRKVAPDGTRHTARRRRVSEEEKKVLAEQVSRLIDSRGEPTVELLTRAIDARTLSFSLDTAELMTRIPEPTGRARYEFTSALAASDDEDHRVLAARIPWLSLHERPESPIATMIAVLLSALGGPADFNPDEMPDDPAEWAELYPSASRTPFPYPNLFRQISGSRMPGLPGCDFTLMLNADRLKQNGTYMGNCTFSYCQRCTTGHTVIGRCTYEGVDYNFALRNEGNQWSAGEINSRFNRGNVPDQIRESVGRLAAGINAALAGEHAA